MCTAVTYKTKDFYFGRTLDYNYSYLEQVTVTPRNYEFVFRDGSTMKSHCAIIGMAYVVGEYPLYYDAVNECGLCMAGLNFVGNAYYGTGKAGKKNIAQFEFIPYILGGCRSVDEARERLYDINLTDTPFSRELPVSDLHWIIADKYAAITVEAVSGGIKIYENPMGVLTNNPPFPEQVFCLNNFMNISPREPENNFCRKLPLHTYSRGMGAIGLPGDLSSQSRFVRACFTKLNSKSGKGESESVGQFFHIMECVSQTRGCCELADREYEITIYTSCCNADKGIYYYTTYGNRSICAVDMKKENLDGNALILYPLISSQRIIYQN